MELKTDTTQSDREAEDSTGFGIGYAAVFRAIIIHDSAVQRLVLAVDPGELNRGSHQFSGFGTKHPL